MDTLKAGIIGTGFIGPLHIEALRRLGNVQVAALADIDQPAADMKAEALNVPAAFGDYRALLAEPEIQAVHICTPNNTHYRMSKEALLAGKHVVCEKPLAMDRREAHELIGLAREKGLTNAVHFNVRFYPLIHHIRQMIKNGDLGAVFAVNGSYQQDWLFKDTDYNWRLEPQFSGKSRAVADIGSHWFDTVEYVTGSAVEEVCADFATFHPVRKKPLKPVETYSGKLLTPEDYADMAINTEDYASVLLRFNNGAHGSLTVNQTAAGRKNRLYFEIYGSKASLAFDSEKPNEMWVGHRDACNQIVMKDPSLLYKEARDIVSCPGGHNEGFPDTSKQLFAKFYGHIGREGGKNGAAPGFPTFEAGLRELEICDAIVSSAEQKKWVEIK